MSRPRAIRFSKEEEKLIEEFLKRNPFFDFSTLGKTAILNFIKNPTVSIIPVSGKGKPAQEKRSEMHGNA